MKHTQKLVLENCRCLDNKGVWSRGKVVIEGAKVSRVLSEKTDVTGTVIDCAGHMVFPGWIDLHVHGAGMCNPARDDVRAALYEMDMATAKRGVTRYIWALETKPYEQTLGILENLKSALHESSAETGCVGIQLEGPFLNPEACGVHVAEWLLHPSSEKIERIVACGGNAVRMVTLAPELPGALDAVRMLADRKVIVSLGHSCASFECACEAIEQGAQHALHCFNGMKPFHHRNPGILAAVLLDERVSIELICDGVHVHAASAELAFRLKGSGRISAVSDSWLGFGSDGKALLPFGVAAAESGNVLRLEDGTLAGGTASLGTGLKNMHRWTGTNWFDVTCLSRGTALSVLGHGNCTGWIIEGMNADLTCAGEDMEPSLCLRDGVITWSKW